MNIEVSDGFYSWLKSTRELFEFPSDEAVLVFYLNRYMGKIPMRDSKQMDIPFDIIYSVISEFYLLPIDLLKSKSRCKKEINDVKSIARYITKRVKGCPTIEIANYLGVDFSTISYSLQIIEERIKKEPELQRTISTIIGLITAKAGKTNAAA